MTGGNRVVDAVRASGAVPDEVARATREARWALRWRGWADWSLTRTTIGLAALAVVVDVATAWAGVSLGALGRVAISPALPVALVVLARLRPGRSGRSRVGAGAWREFGVAAVVVVGAATVVYGVTLGRPVEAGALIVAAIGEELVFRLAAVLVIGACVAALLRRDWRHPHRWGTGPGLTALSGAALVFTALPGHVSQITGPATGVSFASLALVLGYTVLRTGAIWPAAAVHATLNLTTITAWTQPGAAMLRLAIAGTALVALVAAADLAGRRLGLRVRVPKVIDLHAVHDAPALR
ncbi:MAG TPA: CPBP family intramembrane glutamic endopeptidase [Acidimicrobiia bacterium]|nr:CPBP family intramembrane glutamic endopeptidase [Acidimicrobiia bacterium]